ncbi:hypothetical protein HG263_16745 [Pseudoalteromonas sp. JBTF-M23]|uniref:Uncharacterized protein n=1 Tax=Pseudoalteromonas caenipelagi TaxID=2726988 RepID=A0A849VEN4_9GAMM|nr:hypothetical protein [Pseudoalteromonas caenipelagi]NOU52179.1 hypothetical protein [Pseudoalteromonas caenipelagi]
MLYAVLTVLLVAVGCFAFLPRFKKTIERYSVGVDFILTLLATLAGVLVSIVRNKLKKRMS